MDKDKSLARIHCMDFIKIGFSCYNVSRHPFAFGIVIFDAVKPHKIGLNSKWFCPKAGYTSDMCYLPG